MSEDHNINEMFMDDFLEDARNMLSEFRKAYEILSGGDRTVLKDMHRYAHSIKGLSAMMGIASNQETAREIEIMIKDIIDGDIGVGQNDMDRMKEGIDRIEEEFNKVSKG